MAGLKEIKNKIHSVKKTRKVTRAMEAVSAVKMRKSQERAKGARAYARSALRILGQVSSVLEFGSHPLVVHRDDGDTAVILVTSDKGLAGSLNSAVLKLAEKFLTNKENNNGNVKWLCLGKRGLDWAERRNYNVIYNAKNLSDDVQEIEMQEITAKAIKMQESKEVSRVYILYTNFKSTFEQDAVMRRVLPLSRGALYDIVAGILPQKAKATAEGIDQSGDVDRNVVNLEEGLPSERKGPTTEVDTVTDYEIEPSHSDLLKEVLPRLTNIVVFHALLENKASEHSARMVAMKNATDKAGEVGMLLQRKFNKARQAAITAEIGEITSGLEAMR